MLWGEFWTKLIIFVLLMTVFGLIMICNIEINWKQSDFINGLPWQWDSGLSPSGSGYKSVAGEYSNREWSGVESSSSRLTTRKSFRGEKLWKSEVNPTLDKIMLSLNQNSNGQVTNGNLNGFKSLKGFKTFHSRSGKKLSQLGCEQNEWNSSSWLQMVRWFISRDVHFYPRQYENTNQVRSGRSKNMNGYAFWPSTIWFRNRVLLEFRTLCYR